MTSTDDIADGPVLHPDIPGKDDPGIGRRLAFDVGKARIGVATCDPFCILATPVTTLHVQHYPQKEDLYTEIRALIDEYEPVEMIVGLPRTLRGHHGSSVEMVMEFITGLRRCSSEIPVRLVDERFSTVVATQALRGAGIESRRQRSVIDQAAAVEILRTWLELRERHLQDGEGSNDGPTHTL